MYFAIAPTRIALRPATFSILSLPMSQFALMIFIFCSSEISCGKNALYLLPYPTFLTLYVKLDIESDPLPGGKI